MQVDLMNTFHVYLETGKKRTFAVALDWPGWCRSGRDDGNALQALLDYSPRYKAVLDAAGMNFQPPEKIQDLVNVEKLEGDATTDFGAPGQIPASDRQFLAGMELARLQQILKACWQAFDQVTASGRGKPLSTGPRGGGRSLEKIVSHVLDAESGYLAQLGGKYRQEKPGPPEPGPLRQVILETLEASARGEVAPKGPRGGDRWPARYFLRRDAWHVLDHAWEVVDRLR